MSYKNPDLLDCRGAKKGTHPGHDKYVLPKVFFRADPKFKKAVAIRTIINNRIGLFILYLIK